MYQNSRNKTRENGKKKTNMITNLKNRVDFDIDNKHYTITSSSLCWPLSYVRFSKTRRK